MIRAYISQLAQLRRAPSTLLLYHSVSNAEDALFQSHLHRVDVEVFENQLRKLQNRLSFLSVADYAKAKRAGEKNIAAVTFDDGYKDNLTKALPVLERLGIPATLYVNFKLVLERSFWRDKVRFLLSEQLVEDFLVEFKGQYPLIEAVQHIRADNFYSASKKAGGVSSQLIEAAIDAFISQRQLHCRANDLYVQAADLQGVESDYLSFGNHSYSHYVLSTLTAEEQWEDIQRNHQLLEEYQLPICPYFSVPFGGVKTLNEETVATVKKLGYEGILLSNAPIDQAGLDRLEAQHGLPFLIRYMPLNYKLPF
ncbi:MAG: polysaccharide deacetylase family protein [Bacteroidota bacterium]